MDLYAVAEYPDRSFQNATETQLAVTARMKKKEKRVKIMWGSMVAGFVACLICGLLGLPLAIVIGIGLMFALFVPTAFLLLFAPSLDCPQCHRRMKKDWAIIESDRSGEFLICPACRIYVYTHRTLR